MNDARLRTLLRQAERSRRLGKTQAAVNLYRDLVNRYPDSAEAWSGLSQVTQHEDERIQALERLAQLAPDMAVGQEEHDKVAPTTVSIQTTESFPSDSEQIESDAKQDAIKVEIPESDTTVSQAFEIEPETIDESAGTCYVHPSRATYLRCNKCSQPICIQCAVKTPVGYRCKNCVNAQQAVFYDATIRDYVLAIIVGIPLAVLATALTSRIGWLTLIIAPFVGMGVAELIRLVARRRRGRALPIIAASCIVIGALPVLVTNTLMSISSQIIWLLAYMVLAAISAYRHLR